MHFHRFMHRVHDELKKLKEVKDPLETVADIFKKETDIICFDEFFVQDITDAMLLGGDCCSALPQVEPGDPFQIQYTSGTTGFPKGAVIHHRG